MNTWKTVGQADPVAATPVTAYTVPAATQFVGSVRVANRGAATAFRVWVALNGAGDANPQYLAFDKAIGANDTDEVLVVADAADLVRVYATLATLSFNVRGVEKT